MFTIGSLFSGIGGIEKGLESAGLGTTVWQCEIDPFCREVLAKHWPTATRYDNIMELHNPPKVDILCGGFPCQDLSHAGKRAGLEGDRSGLWKEFLRIIGETSPTWVVIENVHHAWGNWVPTVRGDLASIGYSSVSIRLSASEIGADHERRRVFVIAHADRKLLWDLSRRASRKDREVETQPRDPRWGTAASRVARSDDGVPFGIHRRTSLGNAVVPQVAEVIGKMIMESIHA